MYRKLLIGTCKCNKSIVNLSYLCCHYDGKNTIKPKPKNSIKQCFKKTKKKL